MSEPYASAPPSHPRDVKSTPGIQSGIAIRSTELWGFENIEKNIIIKDRTIPPDGSVRVLFEFLDGEERLKNIVRDTIKKDRRPSRNFETWEDYANVRFIEIPGANHIRITFDATTGDDWYWSTVGLAAKRVRCGSPTMKLAGLRKMSRLPFSEDSLKVHRGHILHEFGHALGLQHEHQGPAARRVFELNRDEVLKDERYCEPQMWRIAEDNILYVYRQGELMNYTKFDKDSIMIYDIPKEWRQVGSYEGKIVQNFKLSKLDKAFIQLIYPPNLSKSEAESGVAAKKFRHAVLEAGVPPKGAGKIFSAYGEDNRTLEDRLMSVRNCFNHLREGAWTLWNSQQNPGIAHMIDPASSTQFGVDGFIGDIAENRLFQSIVKNIVHRTMEQHGIPARVPLPGSTQLQVTGTLAALAMDNDFGRHINQHVSQLGDLSTAPSALGPQDTNSTTEDRSPRAGS